MTVQLDLEAVQALLEREFPQIRGDLAFETLAPLTARVRLCAEQRHLRPGGTVSGPTMMMLADVAFYAALLGMIGPQVLAVTTNLNINFMRKPAPGDLYCDARILKLGKLLATGEALIHDGDPARLAAHATLTYAIPPKGTA